jgi:competence protein ComFB
MSLRESYNFEFLINEAEHLVLEQLEEELGAEKAKDICKCQDCVLDMAALALNSISPMYRVSLMGTLYAHNLKDTDYEREVRKKVVEAIEKIAKNPSHD